MKSTYRAALAALLLACALPVAHAAEPLVIGFDIELTGGLAPNGKAALLAMQIWAEETNAKGGLLGRPVKLLYYDDQSNPSTVPGIITKLLEVDHVDMLIGGNGTNMLAPAMPVIMQRNLTFLGLFGLDVNSEFHYPKYFSIIPAGGPTPKEAFSQGFFAVAATLDPKPHDDRAGRRRCGVFEERGGWRARPGEADRLQDRLRSDLSADHRRLHADRSRHPGNQS